MRTGFTLKRIADIAPSQGEDLGGALARFAVAEEERYRANPSAAIRHWGSGVAQLLYLAGDAFSSGAAASIGHNRSDRYEERARELFAKAEQLIAEAKADHDAVECASLLAAFDDGYAGRDITRHSFDRRDAAIVGQLFAKEGRARPERINKVFTPRPLGRDSARDHLLIDGEKFVVEFPAGKIADGYAVRLEPDLGELPRNAMS